MTREQAIEAGLMELSKLGIGNLKSRTPRVRENVRMLGQKAIRGWQLTFDLIPPKELPEHDIMLVEVYEPSGKVVVYPTI
jgi:hypothetical protein